MNYSSRPPARRPRPAPSCPVTQPAPEPVQEPCPSLPLAIATVPMQQFGETYPPEVALCKGTLFPELDLPYRGGGPCCR